MCLPLEAKLITKQNKDRFQTKLTGIGRNSVKPFVSLPIRVLYYTERIRYLESKVWSRQQILEQPLFRRGLKCRIANKKSQKSSFFLSMSKYPLNVPTPRNMVTSYVQFFFSEQFKQSNEPETTKCTIRRATSEDSDQPVHPPNTARIFV